MGFFDRWFGSSNDEETPDIGKAEVPKDDRKDDAQELPSDPEALCQMGNRYKFGEGVPEDPLKAFLCYKKAAELGHDKAQFMLGGCYSFGKGTETNQDLAIHWWRRAAEQGTAEAQHNLADAYETGTGVEKDLTQALYWYKEAAKQRILRSILKVGLFYADGIGGDGFRIDDAEQILERCRPLEKDETEEEFWQELEKKIRCQKDRKQTPSETVKEETEEKKMENIDAVAKMLSEAVAMGADTLDNLESKMSLPFLQGANLHLRDILMANMLDFLLYLSSTDGDPDWDECFLISRCLGLDRLTPQKAKELLAGKADRETFFKKMPEIMLVCKAFDAAIRSNPQNDGKVKSGTAVIQLYEIVGSCLIKSDNNVSSDEFRALNMYLEMMRGYETYSPDQSKMENGAAAAAATETVTVAVPAATGETKKQPGEKSLPELLEELNSLIGLADVKSEVNSLINLVKMRKRREQMGLRSAPMSLHLVFTGNPGTGKTTVARLLSKIYYHLGILSKGHLVEVDRSGLVGGYVGQTAIKTQEVIQKSLGGILFIDEAYSLANKGDNDYGNEAIDTILKAMEDHRDDLILIVAGYPEKMEGFLQSNPGLPSRFNKRIFFADYTPENLVDIFKLCCRQNNYQIGEGVEDFLREFFTKHYEARDENFANGRFARNFFEKVIETQANRLSAGIENANAEELQLLTMEDVRTAEQ